MVAMAVLFIASYSVAHKFYITSFIYYYKLILEYSQGIIILASLYINLSELQIFPQLGIMIESLK